MSKVLRSLVALILAASDHVGLDGRAVVMVRVENGT